MLSPMKTTFGVVLMTGVTGAAGVDAADFGAGLATLVEVDPPPQPMMTKMEIERMAEERK